MDVGGAVLVGLPDDLVDELDDAGLLVALGDFLVFPDEQFHGLILVHFVEGLGADTVIVLQRLLDFHFGGEGETDRAAGVKTHRVDHGGVERVADGDLDGAVVDGDGQN